MEKNLA